MGTNQTTSDHHGRSDCNVALVAGHLTNDPETRSLPTGALAVSFSLTVRAAGEKTTSVPVVWYDPPKRIKRWVSGDHVTVQGAVVRRFFRGSSGLGSATEVVAHHGELTRHVAKSAALRERTQRLTSAPETKG